MPKVLKSESEAQESELREKALSEQGLALDTPCKCDVHYSWACDTARTDYEANPTKRKAGAEYKLLRSSFDRQCRHGRRTDAII